MKKNPTNSPTTKTTAPLNDTQLLGLIETIEHCDQLADVPYGQRTLTVEDRVLLTLDYLSENRTEQALATTYRVSQPTVSRIISTFTDLIAGLLEKHRPTPADFQTFAGTLVVDGTLVTCWGWRDHHDLYSGKHKTTGLNLQVACDLDGHLMWVSDPKPGSWHDLRCIRESEFPAPEGQSWNVTADKGYIGWSCTHPIRKPKNGSLTEEDKDYNRQVNSYRAVIERVNAHLKNWHILKTRYRRPIKDFTNVIRAIIGMMFYNGL